MSAWLDSPIVEIAFWTVLTAILSSVSCALVGCYLVLRRMSLLGDAISHAVLPGIALAFLLSGQITGVPIVLGAMLLGILTSVLTHTLHAHGRVPEDASMGVVFTTLFAAGVIMITRGAANVDLDPGCVLYGLIEFVPLDRIVVLGWELPRAIPTLVFTLVAVLAFIGLLWKELKIVSFDPALASALGIPAVAVHYALMAMVAGVTVASFEAVGSILVVAMLIVPGATAHLLTDRLGPMLGWSVLVAVLSSAAGYAIGVRWNTSVAGAMAVAAGLLFAAAVFLAPRHGIISRWLRKLRLSLRIAREDMLAMLYRSQEAAERGERVSAAASRRDARLAGRSRLASLALVQLRRRGLIHDDRGTGVELTSAGREQAKSVVRAHRLWEAYLGTHFELPLDHLHEPAERVEHYIDPQLQEKLERELARPDQDPHGRRIPPA